MTEQKISEVLDFLAEWGGVEGDHHKAWVIDQTVRLLTNCPIVEKIGVCWGTNMEYPYEALGESEEYLEFVRTTKHGEEGPDTYRWDEGIAP